MDDRAEALVKIVRRAAPWTSHGYYLTRAPRTVILILPPLLVLCFSTCCLPRHPIQAARFLESVAHPERPQKEQAPRRTAVSYERQGRAHRGDLYLPSQAAGGILLVAGAAEEGKNDPRLVKFATALARANFAVLVPDLIDVRHLKLGARDIRQIADGFSYLASRTDLAPQGCAGMAAPSSA